MSRYPLSMKKLIIYSIIILFSILKGKTVMVSGSINNADGEPLKKVKVSIRNLKDEIFMETQTNRKGQFKFEDVKPRFYYLVAEDLGYGSKRIKLNPRKNKNGDLNLTLELNGQSQNVDCYLFNNNAPTVTDPVLSIKDLSQSQ